MANENTEIVVTRHEFDLKAEAKKQLRIAAVDSINCARRPAKDFTNCLVDKLFYLVLDWVENKLSA